METLLCSAANVLCFSLVSYHLGFWWCNPNEAVRNLSANVLSVADTMISAAQSIGISWYYNEYINIHQCSFEHVHQAIYICEAILNRSFSFSISHTHTRARALARQLNSYKSQNIFPTSERTRIYFFNFGIRIRISVHLVSMAFARHPIHHFGLVTQKWRWKWWFVFIANVHSLCQFGLCALQNLYTYIHRMNCNLMFFYSGSFHQISQFSNIQFEW